MSGLRCLFGEAIRILMDYNAHFLIRIALNSKYQILNSMEIARMRTQPLIFCLAIIVTPAAFALDAACDLVLKASEARINQPAWHSISELAGGKKMETIKVDGAFYQQMSGKWKKIPFNLDDSERKLLAQIRAGEVGLSECQILGNDTFDGKPVTVIKSRTEVAGAPVASATKLYVGKSDGLPYRQVGEKVTVEYRYTGVVAPKL